MIYTVHKMLIVWFSTTAKHMFKLLWGSAKDSPAKETAKDTSKGPFRRPPSAQLHCKDLCCVLSEWTKAQDISGKNSFQILHTLTALICELRGQIVGFLEFHGICPWYVLNTHPWITENTPGHVVTLASTVVTVVAWQVP